MLYIVINGKREYLTREIAEKYRLKPGMRTPFTGCKIFEDSKKEIIPEGKEGEVT